jgi:hypothetical protein
MLIDRFLPTYDVAEVHEIEVSAPPLTTYEAIRRADLRDPLITALFLIRELPTRLIRRLRHSAPPRPRLRSFTFAEIALPEMGWVLLFDEPGNEFVVGSIGRFWRGDYGWRPVESSGFVAFQEPGYAKIAVSFSVRRHRNGSILRYEARTATTDEGARHRFLRYWHLIRPGVAIIMRRALHRIRAEAELAG